MARAQHRGIGPTSNSMPNREVQLERMPDRPAMVDSGSRAGMVRQSPVAYKLSVRSGKINLSPVNKKKGRNVVTSNEIQTFASGVLPEGGREKEIAPPRLGGFLPEKDTSQEERTGYRSISPPVNRQALRPTPERRAGTSLSQAMNNRGGSGLQPNNNNYIPERRMMPPALPTSPTDPERIPMPAPIERDEDRAPPINVKEIYRNMKEVNPDTGGFEAGQAFYGGGKVHTKKKRKKKMYGGKMKKYAKGGGIRKPKYS
tara:strand:- start:420 stop:1193 length:774 start_codon:yes stop_codon:yes gene_type:complete